MDGKGWNYKKEKQRSRLVQASVLFTYDSHVSTQVKCFLSAIILQQKATFSPTMVFCISFSLHITCRCGPGQAPSLSKLLNVHFIRLTCLSTSLILCYFYTNLNTSTGTPLSRKTAETANFRTMNDPTSDLNGKAGSANTEQLWQWQCPSSPTVTSVFPV